MMTKNELLAELNKNDNAKKLGFTLLGDDGINQYWKRGQIRLNRREDSDFPEDKFLWSDDVAGWEIK